jgi:DNA-binding transcriptional LysR family regulator
MDIKQIRAFISVANHLSFTKASEEMFMTQSSISKIIKALEDELETQLFYRNPKIQLTDSGQELYKQSVNLISLMDNIPIEIHNLIKLKKGVINIGIPPIIGASFFPRIIGEFKSIYPNIEIKLLEVGSKIIEEKLEKGDLDIGIVCSFPKDKSNFDMFQYIKSPLMLGVNIDNPLAGKDRIFYKELRDENFILFQQDFSLYDFIIGRCVENNFEPNIICNSSQRDFIIEMVATNLGVTFLPEITTSTIKRSDIKFIPLEDPPINLNLMILWKSDRYLSYASKKWLEFAASKKGIELNLKQ